MIQLQNYITEDDIKKDVAGEEDIDEERIVGTQDDSDQDEDDTTPSEAERSMDEGEEILKEERKHLQSY